MKLLLALLLAGAAVPALQSVDITLPADESMFAGPDADLLNGNCLACHGTEMVLFQPKMTAEAWGHSVTKMRNVYKAPISDEDAALLPAALERVQGK